MIAEAQHEGTVLLLKDILEENLQVVLMLLRENDPDPAGIHN